MEGLVGGEGGVALPREDLIEGLIEEGDEVAEVFEGGGVELCAFGGDAERASEPEDSRNGEEGKRACEEPSPEGWSFGDTEREKGQGGEQEREDDVWLFTQKGGCTTKRGSEAAQPEEALCCGVSIGCEGGEEKGEEGEEDGEAIVSSCEPHGGFNGEGVGQKERRAYPCEQGAL